MIFEEKLVEELRARIHTHRGLFQHSEAAIRYALIDPLLRALGWDTANPVVVRPEYHVGNGKTADYVLFVNRLPTIVVECKKQGTSLRTKQ